jgi:hypothetical protein
MSYGQHPRVPACIFTDDTTSSAFAGYNVINVTFPLEINKALPKKYHVCLPKLLLRRRNTPSLFGGDEQYLRVIFDEHDEHKIGIEIAVHRGPVDSMCVAEHCPSTNPGRPAHLTPLKHIFGATIT